ncbi:MAG TPA: T9SS type A sorting domain-containing protein, partial [Bacteroidales bacterium]|nr:T9SS type A sorting domain-containing protein [Bacteroidales bacterium]
GKVSVVVYNYFGQQVKTLVAENQVAGQHQIELNRHDLRDAGQYFYRITLEGQMKTWQVRGTVVFVK